MLYIILSNIFQNTASTDNVASFKIWSDLRNVFTKWTVKNHKHQITNFIKIFHSNNTICIALWSSLVAFSRFKRFLNFFISEIIMIYISVWGRGKFSNNLDLFCILSARLRPKLLKYLLDSSTILKLFVTVLPFIGLGNLLERCLRFSEISFIIFHVRLMSFWQSLKKDLYSAF